MLSYMCRYILKSKLTVSRADINQPRPKYKLVGPAYNAQAGIYPSLAGLKPPSRLGRDNSTPARPAARPRLGPGAPSGPSRRPGLSPHPAGPLATYPGRAGVPPPGWAGAPGWASLPLRPSRPAAPRPGWAGSGGSGLAGILLQATIC
jgi:hypothetical protein